MLFFCLSCFRIAVAAGSCEATLYHISSIIIIIKIRYPFLGQGFDGPPTARTAGGGGGGDGNPPLSLPSVMGTQTLSPPPSSCTSLPDVP